MGSDPIAIRVASLYEDLQASLSSLRKDQHALKASRERVIKHVTRIEILSRCAPVLVPICMGNEIEALEIALPIFRQKFFD